jgi:putative hydrolase of the HAD superfamily
VISAVVFDIDDTLQDWEAAVERALRAVLPDAPPELRDELPERLRRAIEGTLFILRDGQIINREHWKLQFDSASVWRTALPDGDPNAVESLARRFQSLLDAAPFADAAPALAQLQADRAGYLLATLSNNPQSEQWLARLGLREYFSVVEAAEGPPRKPHPEIFLRTCRALEVAPGEAVYVGDSIDHDVEGALAVGMTPVWLDRHGLDYGLPAGAHRIAMLSDLPRVLAGLGS